MAFEKMSKAFLYVPTKTLHFVTLKYDKQSIRNGLLEIETSAKDKKKLIIDLVYIDKSKQVPVWLINENSNTYELFMLSFKVLIAF